MRGRPARIERLPQQYFGGLLARVTEHAGLDGEPLVDLGRGNPETGPPAHVVAALDEAAGLEIAHGYDLKKSTPLWFYVLREAEVRADGLTLGPVGGRIVAEVLVGLIESDPGSFLVQEPRWRPTLTSAGAGFRMVDFLRFAGVDPASRGQ